MDPKHKQPTNISYTILAEDMEAAADQIEWVMRAEDFVFQDLLVTGPL